jgi:hypothetical protein
MIILNGELIRMWKEACMTYFTVTCRHIPGRIEDNMEVLNQDRHHNQVSSEYMSRRLHELPWRCCLMGTDEELLLRPECVAT